VEVEASTFNACCRVKKLGYQRSGNTGVLTEEPLFGLDACLMQVLPNKRSYGGYADLSGFPSLGWRRVCHTMTPLKWEFYGSGYRLASFALLEAAWVMFISVAI
jgi:hypothetical protein